MQDLGNSGRANGTFDRRTVLRASGSAALLAATGGLLQACASKTSPTGSTSGGKISFGSNYNDPAPRAAFKDLIKHASSATGVDVNINTVERTTFENNISTYLQGTPDDLITWTAGYGAVSLAKQGLLAPIDDVWDKISGNFGGAAKELSSAPDGHYYLVPIYNYPWVVFYNKSTFSEHNYEIPTTWDEMIQLCDRMKSDGLIPFAMGQKEGWPALGTFDILNMRINGFEYHMNLCKHKVSWADPGVTAVFKQWSSLLPYTQSAPSGRAWADACKALEHKQAGMMFQGSNQIAAQYVSDGLKLDDLDFFAYPEVNPEHGQDAIDAPTDGFALTAKAKNAGPAKAILEYLGSPEAATAYLQSDQWDVAVATNADVPTYNSIQKKSQTVINEAKHIAQYLDRDTETSFALAQVAHAVDQFLQSPTDSTIKTIQKQLEDQAKAMFVN